MLKMFSFESSNPLHQVLPHFLYIPDPLQNISNVINPSFLDVESLGGLVYFNCLARRALDQLDKSFGQSSESVVSSGILSIVPANTLDANIRVSLQE